MGIEVCSCEGKEPLTENSAAAISVFAAVSLPHTIMSLLYMCHTALCTFESKGHNALWQVALRYYLEFSCIYIEAVFDDIMITVPLRSNAQHS